MNSFIGFYLPWRSAFPECLRRKDKRLRRQCRLRHHRYRFCPHRPAGQMDRLGKPFRRPPPHCEAYRRPHGSVDSRRKGYDHYFGGNRRDVHDRGCFRRICRKRTEAGGYIVQASYPASRRLARPPFNSRPGSRSEWMFRWPWRSPAAVTTALADPAPPGAG